MLVRIRVAVTDRPGSLGAVATALGKAEAEADIVAIEVLSGDDGRTPQGRAVDDFLVQVRDSHHLVLVHAAVGRVLGATVVGMQQPAPAVSGHAELALVHQVVAAPTRGLQTLVDGLPGVLGADWAAVIHNNGDAVTPLPVATSVRYPGHDHVRLSATARLRSLGLARIGGREPYGAGAVAPLGSSGLAVLVAREHGLAFHPSELARLGELAAVTARVVADDAIRTRALLDAAPVS